MGLCGHRLNNKRADCKPYITTFVDSLHAVFSRTFYDRRLGIDNINHPPQRGFHIENHIDVIGTHMFNVQARTALADNLHMMQSTKATLNTILPT